MSLSPLLLFHICAGAVGLLSGAAAISFRKGSRSHGLAGIVFSVSMLGLAASGAYIAYLRSQTGNILGGVLTFYMVATAWMAARRRGGQTGVFDWVALVVALAVGTSCLRYGFHVLHGEAGSKDGVPAGMDFFLGFVVLLAAAGDIRMLVRGGVSGAQRIARHLWRMCFALFIASGSFFMGRQQIFPAFIRKSNVLLVLTILPLILLSFWLIRVRFTKVYERKLKPCEGDGYSVPT
jgi:uncharacterized membrane protein